LTLIISLLPEAFPIVFPVVFRRADHRSGQLDSSGLALNLWTADLMGIIPGGGSDVQTKKKNIYERAEG
jgi:hypothetical protein